MSNPQTTKFDEGNLMPVTTKDGELAHTKYARPEGTRGWLYMMATDLRKLVAEIEMPGDFAVKARNLCIDMDNERNRRE